MNPNKKSSKTSDNFICLVCDFITSRKSQMCRHESTPKHIFLSNPNKILIKKVPHEYSCHCGKVYKHLSSLCAHRKKCAISETTTQLCDVPDNTINTLACLFQEQLKENQKLSSIVLDVVKENKELSELMKEQNKQIIELASKVGSNTIHNTTNNHFNLHFFLNEQCKDALNIMEFVNTIKLQLSDLDMMGKLGYTEGISKIFIRGLKELDVFKRPIHCSDLKRETMYIKDKDAWEKENGENRKMKQAINYIANQNIKQLPIWVKENPASEDTETKKHMEYIHIVHESMGGSSLESQDKKHNKIIRNIAKEVIIEKQ